MRYLVAMICGGCLAAASAVWASDEPAEQTKSTPAASATSPADKPEQSDQAESKKPDDKWRFRQHQGIWWYWLPTNSWVYWSGEKWVPYDEAGYAEFYRARHPAVVSRGNSTAGGNGYPQNQTGYWGPVRYDRYGNRQYPYSQRRSGLQQLGPVPAMGGVRSLPGWGGER